MEDKHVEAIWEDIKQVICKAAEKNFRTEVKNEE